MSAVEARERLEGVPSWELSGDGDAISRQFAFRSFADAMAFVVRLGFAAEAADHHPDILITFKRVTVTYSTHSAGGLTQKDFTAAREADELAGLVSG